MPDTQLESTVHVVLDRYQRHPEPLAKHAIVLELSPVATRVEVGDDRPEVASRGAKNGGHASG